jgi:hypothetical protein
MTQDINKFPFGTLTRRKSLSIPGPQRSDVGVAELSRDPPVLETVTPIEPVLLHWFPSVAFAFWSVCDSSATVLCS